MNEEASEYKLEPREKFTTPKLALTYSCEGLGGASQKLPPLGSHGHGA